MTNEDLQRIAHDPGETRGVEFKGPMAWSDLKTQTKVVKAALAFANTEDGGVLFFGFEEYSAGKLRAVGLTLLDAEAFNTDDVQDYVNAHAAPPISLSVHTIIVNEMRCVAIVVQQFGDYPVICTQAIQLAGEKKPEVRKGALYCRSRTKNETTEIQSPDDLRELVRLASLRELRRYLQIRAAEAQPGPTDIERFNSELRGWDT